MVFVLTFAGRRRSLHHLSRLFSTSTAAAAAAAAAAAKPSPLDPLSTVTDSLLCHESDPTRSISTLFSFPDPSCARYAADHSLRRLSQSLNYTSLSSLLDSFLPLASSEQDFACVLLSYGSAFLPYKALSAFRHRLAAGGSLSVSALSFNALLSAFIRSKRHREVPDLFLSVCEEHSISPDVVSYGILIQALFLSNRSTDAFAMLKQLREEQGILLTDRIYKLLLVSLRNHERREEADRLWNEMVANGVKLGCTAYNVKVWYHAFRGETEKVLEVINEMELAKVKSAGIKPNTITYNYLIGCHSKNNRVEDVKEVYKMMASKKGCSPNAATFKSVLLCLCRFGDFEMGMEVFRDSLRNNEVPHFGALKELVEGLVKEGKVEVAKEVIKEVRSKVSASLTSHWKEVEKKLGLDSVCKAVVASQDMVI